MAFLFERLDPAPFDLRSAIRAQVERIVSTRLVDGDADGQFGMPSVVDLSGGDQAALAAYARRLCRLIERYEPRLRQPQVALAPGPHALMPQELHISGILAGGAGEESFSFALARGSGL
ncbi:MAG: GPW/gp25 family protein [Pseudomonadota bacterium]